MQEIKAVTAKRLLILARIQDFLSRSLCLDGNTGLRLRTAHAKMANETGAVQTDLRESLFF
jgi:hypothetical protein